MFLSNIVNYIGDTTIRTLYAGGPSVNSGLSRILNLAGRSISSLIFQQGKPILDSEMNAVSALIRKNLGGVLSEVVGSGFIKKGAVIGPSGATAFDFGKSVLVFEGQQALNIAYNNLPGDVLGKNRVGMNAKPGAGSREDLVYLEIWYEEIEPTNSTQPQSKTLYAEGGSDSGTLTNELFDATALQETTRAIQLRWKIRVADGINFVTHPKGLTSPGIFARGSNAAASAHNFVEVEGGPLFVAGAGLQADAVHFGAVEGHVYAIPLFKVPRTSAEAAINTAGIESLMPNVAIVATQTGDNGPVFAKQHGALGDATANDTAALQDIIDTYVGREIYLDPGIYKVSALNLFADTKFIGPGRITDLAITTNTYYSGNVASVIPTSGTWRKGDFKLNIGSDDSIWAFVCVTGGTPGTWVALPTDGGASTPIDAPTMAKINRVELSGGHAGQVPPIGTTVFEFVATQPLTFQPDFGVESQARSRVVPGGTGKVYEIYKNGVHVGSISFQNNSAVGSFSTDANAAVSLNSGDVLRMDVGAGTGIPEHFCFTIVGELPGTSTSNMDAQTLAKINRYELTAGSNGTPNTGATLFEFVAAQRIDFAIGQPASVGRVRTTGGAGATLEVLKNNVAVGNITIPNVGNAIDFSALPSFFLDPGDVLRIDVDSIDPAVTFIALTMVGGTP